MTKFQNNDMTFEFLTGIFLHPACQILYTHRTNYNMVPSILLTLYTLMLVFSAFKTFFSVHSRRRKGIEVWFISSYLLQNGKQALWSEIRGWGWYKPHSLKFCTATGVDFLTVYKGIIEALLDKISEQWHDFCMNYMHFISSSMSNLYICQSVNVIL